MAAVKLDQQAIRKTMIFLCASLAIISLWFLLRSSRVRQIKDMRLKIKQADENFDKIGEIITKNGTVKAGLAALERDYLSLKSRFPAYSQDVMGELSVFARNRKLAISSITPSAVEVFKGPQGQFQIGSLICKVAKFNIIAAGSFINIGEYFQGLTSSFPFTVTVESFYIKNDIVATASVTRANIVLSAYLLSE